ncbi:PREDICTED: polyhomeotic-like protein 2, partial [Chaetura pelagica]|uniref:polyhomeotic-like protein 2 n=1 Tax=Chaetura pelagica TaxID=8897 RepID=UPI000523522D
ASLAANRQSSSSGGTSAQPAPAQQPTINLATSPAAAQLVNRAQSGGPGAAGMAQQAVLLGNAASPALTASQAQMYLRAQMLNHSQEDSSRCSDNSSYEEPLSPISASSSTSRRRQGERDLELRDMELPDVHVRDLAGIGHRFLPSEPSKWNVEDVYEFIRSLPGCQEIAEEFRAQEIDGQALLLLKEDHLMSTMNIKLGPALKIYARISMLKDS